MAEGIASVYRGRVVRGKVPADKALVDALSLLVGALVRQKQESAKGWAPVAKQAEELDETNAEWARESEDPEATRAGAQRSRARAFFALNDMKAKEGDQTFFNAVKTLYNTHAQSGVVTVVDLQSIVAQMTGDRRDDSFTARFLPVKEPSSRGQ